MQEGKSGRILRRPQQDYPAATVDQFCTAVLTEALAAVGPAAREEIFALFPELMTRDYRPHPARNLPSGRLARRLAVRHLRNGKALVM